MSWCVYWVMLCTLVSDRWEPVLASQEEDKMPHLGKTSSSQNTCFHRDAIHWRLKVNKCLLSQSRWLQC